MGLLDEVKSTGKVQAAGAPKEGANDKRAKAKERKKAKAEALSKILSYLQQHPIDELKEQVTLLTSVPARTGFGVAFTHTDLFGADAKKGAKISAVDVFVKFHKGYPEMKKYMRKWEEKGIKVHLDAATQSYILD